MNANHKTTHWCSDGTSRLGPVHECSFCGICPECGNDHVCAGQKYCSDCLPKMYPDSNSAQATASDSPMPQRHVSHFGD